MATLTRGITLGTEAVGVKLCGVTPQDAVPLFQLIEANRDHLSRWGDNTSAKYPDFESVLASIVRPANPARRRFGIWWGRLLVGTINLTPLSQREAEIDYWVPEQYGGRGFATAVTKRLVQYAHNGLGYEYIAASVHCADQAGELILRRAGFRRVSRSGALLRFVWVESDREVLRYATYHR